MPDAPEKQQSDEPPRALAAFAAQAWPQDAIKREAALIAAYPASRAQFTLLLDTLRGLV